MTETEALGVALLGSFAALLIVSIIWYILQVIANWKIFTKAGEAGWKSIIPFYNSYILFKISWKTLYFWILLALAVISGIISTAAPDSTVGAVIAIVIAIVSFVIGIIQMNKLSKAFGHGAGFTVGLVLLNPIFMLILGLGSSQYVGNTSENN